MFNLGFIVQILLFFLLIIFFGSNIIEFAQHMFRTW